MVLAAPGPLLTPNHYVMCKNNIIVVLAHFEPKFLENPQVILQSFLENDCKITCYYIFSITRMGT
jgi:hypothetical protein